MGIQASNNIREIIVTINRDSGISNNMMTYRLALVMEQARQTTKVQNTVEIHSQERENLKLELRSVLTKATQNVEDYRQNLKNKYLSEYLNKFDVSQQAEQVYQPQLTKSKSEFSRVETLIKKTKNTFLQEILDSSKSIGLSPKIPKNNNMSRPTEIAQSDNNHSFQKDEVTTKKLLISAILQTIIAQGKDTPNEGRVYEGMVYKLQLLIEDGMQYVNVNRKNDHNKKAFAACKDETNQFTITENNLSPQEIQKLIAFNKKRLATEQAQSHTAQLDKDSASELGE